MAETAADTSRLVGRFFAWWGGELAATLPRRVRELLTGRTQARVLEFDRGEIRVFEYRGLHKSELGHVALADLENDSNPAALADARRLFHKPVKARIVLPPDQALYKLLTLPIMATADLRDALAFQIDRQTPFSPDNVYFDYRIRERDNQAKRLSVELVVAPRPVVERAVATARRLGADPSSVGVSGPTGANLPEFNLLPRAMASRQRNLRPLLVLLIVVAIAAGAWAFARIALDQKTATATALFQQVDLARQRAEKIQALKDERDALIRQSGFLSERKARAPKPVLFIEELTRALPDHTWLFHLQQNGTQLRLSGYTSDASSLIGLVGALPMFDDPKFGSPVTHDPRRDKDRFNLVVELNADAAGTEGQTANEPGAGR